MNTINAVTSISNHSNYNQIGTPTVQSMNNRTSGKRNSNVGNAMVIPRGMITPNGFLSDPTAPSTTQTMYGQKYGQTIDLNNSTQYKI